MPRTCEKCGISKSLKSFRQTGPNSTGPRGTVCMVCEAAEKPPLMETIKEQSVESRIKRRTKQLIPVVGKKLRETRAKMGEINKATRKKRNDEKKAITAAATARAKKQLVTQSKKLRAKNAASRKATAAERELAARALMRRRLLPFIKKFQKKYEAGWVHEDICARLERFVDQVEKGESPRLMLFMPPRHGKSEIASKNLPAWALGRHPEWEIIASSYAVSLPLGFSRYVQSTVQDSYYQKLFPETKLNPKAMSAEAWMTTMDGGYVAAGVGGGITGKGAHIFIIDDPVKDAEEADSDTQRQKVWDWWGSTAKTRLAPGGGVLVIQTRWHDDDLSGRMILQMRELMKEFDELIAGVIDRSKRYAKDSREYKLALAEIADFNEQKAEIDRWEIVSYPAIAEHDEWRLMDGTLVDTEQLKAATSPEVFKQLLANNGFELHPALEDGDMERYALDTKEAGLLSMNVAHLLRKKGEALHAKRYPLSRLRNMKRSMQPRHWSALYQQNPVPDEGIYFTKDMIRYAHCIPPLEEMYLFAAWDLAAGEKQTNDWTVGVVAALDWQGYIYLLDMVRIRSSDSETVAGAILDQYKKYPQIQEVGIEKGQLELVVRPALNKLMRKRKQFPTINETLRPITDKLVRARPLQGKMQNGMVLLPQGQPWVEVLVAEFLRFPGGIHDDIVDACAWVLRMMADKKEPPKPGLQKQESWKKRLAKMMRGQDRGKTHMAA